MAGILSGGHIIKLIISFILGIFSWPLLEYLLHRFLGHDLKLRTLFKKEHTRHHAETNYFAPIWYKILAAIPVSIVAMFLVGFAYTSGFLLMYAVYEWFHWSIHARAPRTKLGMILRKHHLAHHFHNPKMNHGVTTRIIDKLTGTQLPIEVVKIPKNIPLPWLFEADKKTIKVIFAHDFQLK